MVMIRPTSATTQTFWIGVENTKCDHGKSSESHIGFEEYSKAETSIVGAAYWVFLSNRIVGYWPISRRIFINGRKTLNFHQPTLAFFLSLFYIFFNVVYIVYYFTVQWSQEQKAIPEIDLILITIWDLLVVVSVIIYRIYWLVRFPHFRLFWGSFIGVVAQITALSSEKETLAKFTGLRRWTLKWLIVFALLGILDCGAAVCNHRYLKADPLPTMLLYTYLEAVICMHNSSALMLVFLIKVITYGFTMCRRKVEGLAVLLQGYKLEGGRNTYFASYHDNRNGCEPREIIQSPGSSMITQVLPLVDELEKCVEGFNRLFGFSLFLETVLGFCQIIFAMYFLASNESWPEIVNTVVAIVIYTGCLVALCVAASGLTEECVGMLASFQKLSSETLSADENYKIQILVSRLSPNPSGIQVAQLFQIRQSLLGAALNTLATYFIVLMQIRQAAVPSGSKEKGIIDKIKDNFPESSDNSESKEAFGDFQFG